MVRYWPAPWYPTYRLITDHIVKERFERPICTRANATGERYGQGKARLILRREQDRDES